MSAHQNVTATLDYSSLESHIKQLETLRDEYNSAYTVDLYTNAVEEVKGAYKGVDCDAFVNKVEEFRDDFDKMYQVLGQYIEHLRNVLKDYRTQQEHLAQVAKTLTGNRS